MRIGLLQQWSDITSGTPSIRHVGVKICSPPLRLSIHLKMLKPLINPHGELIKLYSQGFETIVIIYLEFVDNIVLLTKSLFDGIKSC